MKELDVKNLNISKKFKENLIEHKLFHKIDFVDDIAILLSEKIDQAENLWKKTTTLIYMKRDFGYLIPNEDEEQDITRKMKKIWLTVHSILILMNYLQNIAALKNFFKTLLHQKHQLDNLKNLPSVFYQYDQFSLK